MARIDYTAAGNLYDRARALPLEGLGAWREALAPHLSGLTSPLLDVGAGTGQFVRAFRTWFASEIVAVEPSPAMLSRLLECSRETEVRALRATATHLPIRDHTAGAAWLSTVIHHIPDLPLAALELRRTLLPGAPVLIRSAFPGRLDGITTFRHFPAARRVAESFPTVDAVARAFAASGFHLESLEAIPQQTLPRIAEARERVIAMRRADTTMIPLTDSEFDDGLASLDREIAADPGTPVIDYLDLLVLR